MAEPLPMPLGVWDAAVDEKGRLRIPVSFRQPMANGRAWWIALDGDGKSLQLEQIEGQGHQIGLDADGRLQIPSDLSKGFKGSRVRMLWTTGRLVVMTEEHYQEALQARWPEKGFTC